jgi:zinc protease
MFRAVLVVGLAVVASCALPKPQPPSPPRQTNLGLSIRNWKLPNGLRVVLVNDPHASEVQVTMRYGVGAGDDLEHPGMAHLVEHLMFQQTLGGQSLFSQLQDNTSFFNGFTNYDATTYVSRARPEMLDKLLSIEAVRLGFRCTTITDAMFEREREVVKRELELDEDDDEQWVVRRRAIYPDGHPYRQAIGGSVATVGAITRAQACAFADAHYAPGNAALVISGSVPPERIESALGKFLARIPARLGAAANTVPAASKLPAREMSAPVDEQTLLLAWPLPADPYRQRTLRMIAAIANGAIDGDIKGRIESIDLGDVRAPLIAFEIHPLDGETTDDVLVAVRKVLDKLPDTFTERPFSRRVFDMLRQYAIYGQYASLEDGGNRDELLAEHVLAGRDPSAALADEFRALEDLGSREAANIARKHFTFDHATIVKLMPNSDKKRGRTVTPRKTIHDMGQRRSTPEVARAHTPDTSINVPSVNLQTRTLPNGLKIVLLPLSTVPTVDMRLVFAAGSGDEPLDKRGTAALAAGALTFDLRHQNDVLSFVLAGGSQDLAVTHDRTSFIVRGVDMHIDYLLAGLRRWAIDGRYADVAAALSEATRKARKLVDEEDALVDAWRTALYGPQHPYTRADLVHHLTTTLTVDDAKRFRSAYFTADNATLVIAGRFDVALANRWIDYLFSDWGGRAQPRQAPVPAPAAASLAKVEDLTQMFVRLALPVPTGTRAQRLVAATMLDDIARDVRHQLAAAYVFNAYLAESRLATNVVIEGWIEPARANDVVQLIRDRVQKLRTNSDEAARAFVLARSRVITSLASVTGGASLLAARAETDIELSRPALSDLQTAKDVQTLTIEQMTPILANLDLSRAAMVMRGPADPIKAAYAVLGREPTAVKFDQTAARDDADEPPQASVASRSSDDDWIYVSELEESLTDQSLSPRPLLEINVSANFAASTVSKLVPPGESQSVDTSASGFTFVGQVGLRFARRFSAGASLSIATLSGTYDKERFGVVVETPSYHLMPIDLGVFLHARMLDRVWGGLLLGVHRIGTRFTDETSWSNGIGLGVEVGYDVFHFGPHWLSVLVRGTTGYRADIGSGGISFGVGYRF